MDEIAWTYEDLPIFYHFSRSQSWVRTQNPFWKLFLFYLRNSEDKFCQFEALKKWKNIIDLHSRYFWPMAIVDTIQKHLETIVDETRKSLRLDFKFQVIQVN